MTAYSGPQLSLPPRKESFGFTGRRKGTPIESPKNSSLFEAQIPPPFFYTLWNISLGHLREEENPKPTIDDALMDPDLVPFPRIGYGKYPDHAILRPQWLKSHSRYPFRLHHSGHWHWMTKTLEYAGEPIVSPEFSLLFCFR
jgi:hypothetical protein